MAAPTNKPAIICFYFTNAHLGVYHSAIRMYKLKRSKKNCFGYFCHVSYKKKRHNLTTHKRCVAVRLCANSIIRSAELRKQACRVATLILIRYIPVYRLTERLYSSLLTGTDLSLLRRKTIYGRYLACIGKVGESILGNDLAGGPIRTTFQLIATFISLRTPLMNVSDHYNEFVCWLHVQGIRALKNDIVVVIWQGRP